VDRDVAVVVWGLIHLAATLLVAMKRDELDEDGTGRVNILVVLAVIAVCATGALR
jgi:hypothetical protein